MGKYKSLGSSLEWSITLHRLNFPKCSPPSYIPQQCLPARYFNILNNPSAHAVVYMYTLTIQFIHHELLHRTLQRIGIYFYNNKSQSARGSLTAEKKKKKKKNRFVVVTTPRGKLSRAVYKTFFFPTRFSTKVCCCCASTKPGGLERRATSFIFPHLRQT